MSENTIIRLQKMFVPTASPSEKSEGEVCIKLGWQWASYLLGMTDIMRVRSFWQHTTDEEWVQILLWITELETRVGNCGNVTPPTVTPTPPTPPVEKPSDFGGMFGLSVEEIEELIMGCVNIAAGLKVENGSLYAKDDCCNWVLIGNIASVTAQAAKTPKTLKEAIDDGTIKQLVPYDPIPPHDVPEYHGNDSANKCAKATAMVLAFKAYLSDVSDMLDSIPDLGAITYTLLSGAASLVGLSPLVSMLDLLEAIEEAGGDVVLGAVDDLLANEEFWDDMTCWLSQNLSVADSVTGQDMTTMFTGLSQRSAIVGEEILSIVAKFSPLAFQQSLTDAIPATDCGCSDFIPAALQGTQPGDLNYYDYWRNQRKPGNDSNSYWDFHNGTGDVDVSPTFGANNVYVEQVLATPVAIDRASKSLYFGIVSRTVTGDIPGNEGYVKIGLRLSASNTVDFGDDWRSGQEYGVGVHEYTIDSIADSLGTSGDTVYVTRIYAEMHAALDGGEHLHFQIADMGIRDS